MSDPRSRPMSLEANINAAICILALATEHPQELDQALTKGKSNDIDIDPSFLEQPQPPETDANLGVEMIQKSLICSI